MFTEENPLIVELAGPPQGKGRPRFSRRSGKARAYTPNKTRSYEQVLALAANAAMKGHPPLEGPVSVCVTAICPIPASWSVRKRAAAAVGTLHPTSKPDFDNIAKVLDAFNRIVWRDDSQIVTGLIRKRYGNTPKLYVKVVSLAGGHA